MKQIKSDKVFEKKLRIYDIRFMEELNEFYQKHEKEYGNVNEFLISMIRTGLDVEKIADKNYSDYSSKFANISDKMTELNDCVKNTSYSNRLNMKEIYCKLMTLQKVVMRIYNMALANNEGLSLSNELVKATFYDDLPTELEELENDMKDFYDNKYFKDVDDESKKMK